jgi:U2 small nuclear ribonucleoprotein A'
VCVAPNTKWQRLNTRSIRPPRSHLASLLQDQFDCLDLSDNELPKLENFPLMKRLRSLLLPNNRVSRVADGLGASLPALAHLVLTNNRIAALGEVEALGSLGGSLTSLSLLGNPVTRRQHYRLFTIWTLPRLAVLDFQRVRRKERVAAAKLFASKAGRAFAEEVTRTRYAAAAGAAGAPAAGAAGSSSSSSSSAAAAAAPAFTPEELEAIQAAIASAATGAEIEEIEACLRKGALPPSVAAALGRGGGGGGSSSSSAAAAEGSSAAASAAAAAAEAPAADGGPSAAAAAAPPAAAAADASMDTS